MRFVETVNTVRETMSTEIKVGQMAYVAVVPGFETYPGAALITVERNDCGCWRIALADRPCPRAGPSRSDIAAVFARAVAFSDWLVQGPLYRCKGAIPQDCYAHFYTSGTLVHAFREHGYPAILFLCSAKCQSNMPSIKMSEQKPSSRG